MKRRRHFAAQLTKVAGLALAGRSVDSVAQTPTASTSQSPGQAWPTKPVRIIIPSLAAGSPDRVTRLIAERLAQRWGQE